MEFLATLAANKMFVGITMIMMNLGSRHVMADLTPVQQNILGSQLAKYVVVFCMFFVPTRDVMISIMLTFAFFFVTKELLDDKKFYNIVPEKNENFTENQGDKDTEYQVYKDAVAQRNLVIRRDALVQ